MKITNKNIGGEFPITSLERFITGDPNKAINLFPSFVGDKKRYFFETATDSFCSLVEAYWEDLEIKNLVIWFPFHYCRQTINRIFNILNAKGFLFTASFFDNVTELLSQNLTLGTVVIWMHYNRFAPLEKEVANYVIESGAYLLEDFVLAAFDIKKMTGHGAINSLRKVSPLSLSIAYSSSALQNPQHLPDYNSTRKIAAWQKSIFCKTHDASLETLFLQGFQQAEAILEKRQIINGAPAEDKLLFSFVNWDAILQKRTENYQTLLQGIELGSSLVLPGEYQFLMLELNNRDIIRNFFFKNNVYPAIHWLDAPTRLASGQLSLPVDQRYNKREMSKLARLSKYLLKQYETADI